jgi:hypothetical protein
MTARILDGSASTEGHRLADVILRVRNTPRDQTDPLMKRLVSIRDGTVRRSPSRTASSYRFGDAPPRSRACPLLPD